MRLANLIVYCSTVLYSSWLLLQYSTVHVSTVQLTAATVGSFVVTNRNINCLLTLRLIHTILAYYSYLNNAAHVIDEFI
jgi:hypothetical protein